MHTGMHIPIFNLTQAYTAVITNIYGHKTLLAFSFVGLHTLIFMFPEQTTVASHLPFGRVCPVDFLPPLSES